MKKLRKWLKEAERKFLGLKKVKFPKGRDYGQYTITPKQWKLINDKRNKINNKLSEIKKQRLIDMYASEKPKKEVQEILSKEFKVREREIRRWAKELGLNVMRKSIAAGKVLIYDIETSRITAKLFWTGKQYIRHQQLKSVPKIISISWKWIGEDEVFSLTWDKDQIDKGMLEKFLKVYNNAAMVIGFNNNNFDNKWINTRGAKYGLFVDRFVKSFDIYKMSKKYFRLPSHSMAYMAEYFGLTPKLEHEGLVMWDKIEDGTLAEQKEYLQKMVEYNRGDIITTEELYMTLKPYFSNVTNQAVRLGLPRWGCPVSASLNVKLYKTIFTEMGTVQRILYCEESNHQYKVSNKTYMDFLQRAMGQYWQ